jgi:hypothetical protein
MSRDECPAEITQLLESCVWRVVRTRAGTADSLERVVLTMERVTKSRSIIDASDDLIRRLRSELTGENVQSQ